MKQDKSSVVINVAEVLEQFRSRSMTTEMNLPKITSKICEKYDENLQKLWTEKNELPDDIVQDLIDCLNILKYLCAEGSEYQTQICNSKNFSQNILCTHNDSIPDLTLESQELITRTTLQLIANVCVQNPTTQAYVWNNLSPVIMKCFQAEESKLNNVSAMIIFNIYMSHDTLITPSATAILKTLGSRLKANDGDEPSNEFDLILLDYMLTERADLFAVYEPMDDDTKLLILYYILEFLKDSNEKRTLHAKLVQSLIADFKLKSDSILNSKMPAVDSMRPEEVIVLLEILAITSFKPEYGHILNADGSLFLNLGCLLKSINMIGREGENIFTPVQKLEHTAPNSTAKSGIHHDYSYELKVNIVKCLANLTYRNKKNQKLVREMDILQEVLNCANIDARNPLIKEWSILAIRNICEDNLENQAFIESLTKVGTAKNASLEEFIEETGVMRIKPS